MGNALYWDVELDPIAGADHSSATAFLKAGLARLKRAGHRLAAEFITALTGGGYTFSQAQAIRNRCDSDHYRSRWDDPAAFLRFLLRVRDLIDPHAWPASTPRFHSEPSGGGQRKRGGRPR